MFYKFEHIGNVRDLSGQIGVEGRAVKPGTMLRCGELYKASDVDLNRLREEFHIKAVFDFRYAEERTFRPDREVPGAVNISIPVLPTPPENEPPPAPKEPPQNLDQMFQQIYVEFGNEECCTLAYRRFFKEVLALKGGSFLFHCRQGKDRTGIAALLLLTTLGVSLEDAREEFLLTNQGMRPKFDQMCAEKGESWQETFRSLMFVRDDFLQETLDGWQRRYGSLDNYRREGLELSEADVARLREWYLE